MKDLTFSKALEYARETGEKLSRINEASGKVSFQIIANEQGDEHIEVTVNADTYSPTTFSQVNLLATDWFVG